MRKTITRVATIAILATASLGVVHDSADARPPMPPKVHLAKDSRPLDRFRRTDSGPIRSDFRPGSIRIGKPKLPPKPSPLA